MVRTTDTEKYSGTYGGYRKDLCDAVELCRRERRPSERSRYDTELQEKYL